MTEVVYIALATFGLGGLAGWVIRDWWQHVMVDQFVNDTLDEITEEVYQPDFEDDYSDGGWIRRVK